MVGSGSFEQGVTVIGEYRKHAAPVTRASFAHHQAALDHTIDTLAEAASRMEEAVRQFAHPHPVFRLG